MLSRWQKCEEAIGNVVKKKSDREKKIRERKEIIFLV
jgi:hypothetical protein